MSRTINLLSISLILIVGACSCSQAPIVPDAQAALTTIKENFRQARQAEIAYDARPDCKLHGLVPCADAALSLKAQRANFNAEAAIATADAERTEETITLARSETEKFLAVTRSF
jgi:hypothetical protein